MRQLVPLLMLTLAACAGPSESFDLCDMSAGPVRRWIDLDAEEVSPNELEIVSHGAAQCDEADPCCNPAMFRRTRARLVCPGGGEVLLVGALGICEGPIDGAPLAAESSPPIDERCTIPCPALSGEVTGTLSVEGGDRILTVDTIDP